MKWLFFLLLFLIPLSSAVTELSCNQHVELCIDNPVNLTEGYIQCTNFFNDGHSTNIKLILDSSSSSYCATFSNLSMGVVDGTQIFCETYFTNSFENEYSETYNYSFSCPEPVCGNNVLENGEECDNDNSNLACIAGYNEFCSYCSEDCLEVEVRGPFCGDLNCDTDFENWTNCNIDCAKPAICGDGYLDIGEECDSTESCSSDCIIIEEPKKREHSSITKYEMENDCEPRWECSSFSECLGDVKYRDCTDVNYCEYSYNMPPETVGCEIISDAKVSENEFNFLPLALISLILLLILSILIQKIKN